VTNPPLPWAATAKPSGAEQAWNPQARHAALLTPGIVVAVDDFGWQIACRIGALLRSSLRGPHQHVARALRDRYRFVRLIPDSSSLLSSEVQSVAIDPTERLWRPSSANWRYQTFTPPETGSFVATLQRTLAGDMRSGVRGVLAYAEDEELLREHGVLIQPGRLNVFFVGALVPDIPLSEDLIEQFMRPASGATLSSPLDHEVGLLLARLRDATEQVRDLARESHSLDVVTRGAFLSLALPIDSYTFARLSLEAHGTVLGGLLTPPPAVQYQESVGYEEPPLHFCSVYGQHDERGTAYDRQQLADLMANAISALLLSELLDNDTCATQLGLRNPYDRTYDRLVTIAALRSSTIRAEVVDYAAFQYGAALLDALLPLDMAATPSVAEKTLLQAATERLIDAAGLAGLAGNGQPPLWSRSGVPTQLSELVAGSDVVPPDLEQLVPEPRISTLRWAERSRESLDQLLRLNELGDVLASGPAAGSTGIPPHLPDGSAYTPAEAMLADAWRTWRGGVEQRIHTTDAHGEVRRRLLAVVHELDRRLWEEPPAGTTTSGARYGWLLLELALGQVREAEQRIAQRGGLREPSDAELDAELQRARRRCLARMELGPLVGLSVLLLILLSYLLIGVRGSAAADPLVSLVNRPPLLWVLPISELAIRIPVALYLADLVALVALIVGLCIRQAQTLWAVTAIKTYARLVRRKLAIQLYREEQHYARELTGELYEYLSFLRSYLSGMQQAAQQVATEFRQRAATIGSVQQRRDVAEHSRASAESPAELYREQLAPRVATMLPVELPLLQREAARIWGFAAGFLYTAAGATPAAHPVVHTSDPQLIAERTADALGTLALGDSHASELDPAARLRYLSYHGVLRELDQATYRSGAPLDPDLPKALRERTRLMVRAGLHRNSALNVPYEQEYYVSTGEDSGDAPELGATIYVRGLSDEVSWFVRVANRIWPSLFTGAKVELS